MYLRFKIIDSSKMRLLNVENIKKYQIDRNHLIRSILESNLGYQNSKSYQ